ncbi:MAG: aspartate aminotransferase family protein [Candidatus Woesearchaeota archaeon]
MVSTFSEHQGLSQEENFAATSLNEGTSLECPNYNSRLISSHNEGSTISSENINIQRAEGIYLWDIQGKRYLDLFSQTWSMPLGHCNKNIIQAVTQQLTRITHLRTAYSTDEKSKLIQEILRFCPPGLSKVNFVLHGSLAVEGAMKLAINHYEDRYKILYLEDGFHGRSFATMGISWKTPNHKYQPYFSNGIEVKKNLKDIEEKMKLEHPAAIILELVQGNSGNNILDEGLVQGIRTLCDKYKIIMIIDEVQTAFGCMGKMFLCEDYGVVPDILVFGKALGGGFPLAGTIYKDHFSFQSGDHSFTFGHNPVSMAAGLAYLQELKPLLPNVGELSPLIHSSLLDLESKYPCLRKARCLGLKGAIDVVDKEGNPDPKLADLIVDKLSERGVLIANSRYNHLGNTLMLQPPLIITPDQLDYAFEVFDQVLSEINNFSGDER